MSDSSKTLVSSAKLCRRLLLILLTALLVARPLLPGEDAGMLIPLTDTSGPVLVFLWLVALILWAIGFLLQPGGTWRGGWVEIGLLVVIAVQFLSAQFAASYRHAAWLVSWEWLAMGIVLFLVRQMAGDRRLVLAVVLATGTTVAGFGVYQSRVEFAALQKQMQKQLQNSGDRIDMQLIGIDSMDARKDLAERIERGHAFATFGHPNSFAGYLVLLFPLAIGAALVNNSREGKSPSMTRGAKALLMGMVIALFALAIWFSHSRGGLLAMVIVGLSALAWRRIRWITWQRACVVGGAIVLLIVGLLVSGLKMPVGAMGKNPEAIQIRMEYWTATWAMISDHPWLGVGPGNFVRYYPSYLPIVPQASEVIRDPHQFALELWATSGMFGMLALLFALGVFVSRSVRHINASSGANTSNDETESPIWLFNAGGGLGLLLSLVLSGNLDPMRIGIHAFVWFAAFWIFQRVLTTGAWVVAASFAGVVALLINLLVSGGIGSPAVAQPLWTVVAIGLSGIPSRRWSVHFLPLRLIPLVAAIVLAGAYLHGTLRPVVASDSHLARATKLKTGANFRGRDKEIGDQLRAACAAAATDSRPLIELALWQWARLAHDSWRETAALAVDLFEQALRLDPRNHQIRTYLFEADLELARFVEAERRQLLAIRDKTPKGPDDRQAVVILAQEREEFIMAATQKLDGLLGLNPVAKARCNFLLAELFLEFNDPRARSCARIAWQAHQEARSSLYRLSPAQLQQVEQWREP